MHLTRYNRGVHPGRTNAGIGKDVFQSPHSLLTRPNQLRSPHHVSAMPMSGHRSIRTAMASARFIHPLPGRWRE